MEQYVNRERTVLVVKQDNGTVTVATRPEPDDVWGPPVVCYADRTTP